MLSIHTQLQQEADKIRKWKNQMEFELKLKEKKLSDATELVESLRKNLLEIQLQNETLSSHLSEEIDNRERLTSRIESTREMCKALKEFAATVHERLSQCQTEKDRLQLLTEQQHNQLQEMNNKFESLEIVVEERGTLSTQLECERNQYREHDLEQSKQLEKMQRVVECLQSECVAKETIVRQLSSEVETNRKKAEELHSAHERAVTELEIVKNDAHRLGADLHQIQEREVGLLDKLQQLKQDLQVKYAEISNQQQLIQSIQRQNCELEVTVNTFSNQLSKTTDDLRRATEERNALQNTVDELNMARINFEETMKSRMMELQSELETTRETVLRKSSEIVQLQCDFESASEHNDVLVEQLKELKIDKDMVDAELKNSTVEVSRLKKDLEKMTKQFQLLDESAREDLKNAYAKVEQEQTDKINVQEKLMQRLKDCEAEVQNLEEELSKRDDMLEACKDQLSATKENMDCQIEKLACEKSELESALAESREELDNAESSVKKLSEKVDDLQKALSETIEQSDNKLKTEEELFRQAEAKYKVQLSASNKQIEDLRLEVVALTKDKESAEKQVKAMVSQLAVSLDSYKRGYDDILARKEEEYQGQVQLLNKKMEALNTQLEATRREKEAIELKTIGESARINSLIENSEWELNQAVSGKNREIDDLKRQLETLNESIKQKDQDLADLQSRTQVDLKRKEQTWKQAIECKETEIEDLEKKIESLKKEAEKQKASASSAYKIPSIPSDKKNEQPKPRVSAIPVKSCSTEQMFAPESKKKTPIGCQQQSMLAERAEDRTESLNQSQTRSVVEMPTPRQSMLKESSTLTARKRKLISFKSPTTDSESSACEIVFTPSRHMANARSELAKSRTLTHTSVKTTAPSRDGKVAPTTQSSPMKHCDAKSAALLHDSKIRFKTALSGPGESEPGPKRNQAAKTPLRDGKIYLKSSSPVQKTSISKLAKRRAAANMEWFDVDTVYGFDAED